MSAALGKYLLSMAAAGILLSLAQSLTPGKGARRIASFAGGLLLILTALSPLAKLDMADAAKSLAKLRMEAEILRTGVAVENRALIEAIIKEKTGTYILDKAGDMGLVIQVEVMVSDGTDYPYPTGVTLRGAASETQKARLTRYIMENLGISEERQEWMDA